MPSKRSHSLHLVFFPLVFLMLVLWVVYRSLFSFPVWFDEVIGKAIFFGLPVWLYVVITEFKQIAESFALYKLNRGLLLGLTVGGLYGFTAAIVRLAAFGGQPQPVLLFSVDEFWWEFLLALITGFWETLFFFSFVLLVIEQKFKSWALLHQVLLAAVIFLVFHIPNTLFRFTGTAVMPQLLLLFLFAIGQGFLFAKEQNGFALVLSHAIWGMVLLVHF